MEKINYEIDSFMNDCDYKFLEKLQKFILFSGQISKSIL